MLWDGRFGCDEGQGPALALLTAGQAMRGSSVSPTFWVPAFLPRWVVWQGGVWLVMFRWLSLKVVSSAL